jgi:hypothetical protein
MSKHLLPVIKRIAKTDIPFKDAAETMSMQKHQMNVMLIMKIDYQ